ncbi:MAG: sigma-70 family RNA polymerase sigma factor [Oscillospiraceae bacterium]|nr:sigma-70 family RNA polymerase sigma factor [Oscillospiraceae bacterium]
MMEFTFESSPWEQALENLQAGDEMNMLSLMSLLEEEDEEIVQEALDALAQKGVALSIRDLPNLPVGGNMALRLREEAQLVESGKLLTGLPENDPLRLYLEELAATPAAGDVEMLAQQYLEGDEDAAQKLVTLSLSRVVELASELAGKNVLLLDLIQEGSMGLWQSILCYTGGAFEAHRDWWIRQALYRAIFLQARSGDLGQKLRMGLEDYRDMDQKLLAELGRNPTLEEIAEAMHVTAEEAAVYRDMLNMAKVRRQVDEAMEEKEPEPEDEQAVEDTAYFQMRQRITELLSTLNEADAKLLSLRFGLEGGMPMSPEDAGRKLGMTAQEVVKREANALAKLRQQG